MIDHRPNTLELAPQWLAHRYSHGQDAFQFIDVPRALRRKVPFLTDIELRIDAPLLLRRSEVLTVAPRPAPLHFIFHSAFCCSTLLANAFDLPGVAHALKEPVVLNDLIGWRHARGGDSRFGAVLRDALTLLARPFESGETVVVKPSNLINELAGQILEESPTVYAIFIEAPLPEFLASIAAKGLEGRLWVRDLLAKQVKGGLVRLGFSPDDLFRQTDLQVAAVGWLVQHQLFAALSQRFPDRIRWVTSPQLLADPNRAVQHAALHFGVSLTDGQRAQLVADVFARNAKDGTAFGAASRSAAQRDATTLHADELDKVLHWANVVADHAAIDMSAVTPLL